MADYIAHIGVSSLAGQTTSGEGFNDRLLDQDKKIQECINSANAVNDALTNHKTADNPHGSIVQYGEQIAGTDLNNLNKIGSYFLYSGKSYLNYPSAAAGKSCMLIVTKASNQVFQQLQASDGRVFTRNCGYAPVNNWTEWRVSDLWSAESFRIKGKFVDASGKFDAGSWDMVCFNITDVSLIPYIDHFETYTYAFYTDKPNENSTSYDGKRVVVSDYANAKNIVVPAGCNWIAIRCSQNKNVSLRSNITNVLQLEEMKRGLTHVESMVDEYEGLLYADIDLSDRFSNGMYVNTGKSVGYQFSVSDIIPIANSSTSHVIIPVKSGERYNIIGGGGNASRLWALLDKDRVLKSVSAANVTVNPSSGGVTLLVEADGYLIVNAWTSSAHSVKKLSAVKFETVDPDSKYVEVRVPIDAVINKLVRSNTGEVIDDSTKGSNCTAIDCESAVYIKAVTTVYNGDYGCAFYDSNDTFMYGIKTVTQGEKKFVVPTGAKYFRMCWGRNAITQNIHVSKPVTTLLKDIYEIISKAGG